MTPQIISARDLEALSADTIRSGGSIAFIARGHSMRPAILDGDRVEVGPVSDGGWRLGDVALARVAQGLILHRIVTLGEGPLGAWVEMAADATREQRERLPVASLIGRLTSPQRAHPLRGPWRRLVRRLFQQIRGSSSPSA